MKRVALITLHTPTETNFRGASALPFHLLAYRPEGVEMQIWSYNINGCSDEQIAESEQKLGVKINRIPQPRWLRLLKTPPARLILSKPVLCYLPLLTKTTADIKDYLCGHESAVWIYGEDIAHLAKKFEGYPIVITTPDCETMYYHRVLAMKGIPQSPSRIARYSLMYHRYAKMAAQSPAGPKIHYHLVGIEDARFLKKLNPLAQVVFLPHPHYSPSLLPKQEIKPDEPIRLLVAGRYDFAMAQAVDEALQAISSLPQHIKDRYFITFLGNGWESCYGYIKKAGFSTELKGFVKEYAEELSLHHIQLTPIAVGTGTKGKVLDAFINGLMVIGTPLALENIAAERDNECIEYTEPEELRQWLIRLANNPTEINTIAKAGQKAVLREHNRGKIAQSLFELFKVTDPID